MLISSTKIILHSYIMCVSLSKVSYAKRIVWDMLKKKERKISMLESMREKMHAKEHEEKKRKRKKEIRYSILLNKRYSCKNS